MTCRGWAGHQLLLLLQLLQLPPLLLLLLLLLRYGGGIGWVGAPVFQSRGGTGMSTGC
jgi:hypothetical protein